MKKTYIIPLAEVVRTEAEKMICQSIEIQGSYDEDIKVLENDLFDNAFENVFENLW